MESSRPSLASRLLAIVVLIIVAVLAVRLAFGLVAGLVTAVLWIGVAVALVAGVLWARSTLKRGRRPRDVEPPPPGMLTHEDRVAAEMERIREQMRQQGGG
jgi:hypothetical protein